METSINHRSGKNGKVIQTSLEWRYQAILTNETDWEPADAAAQSVASPFSTSAIPLWPRERASKMPPAERLRASRKSPPRTIILCGTCGQTFYPA